MPACLPLPLPHCLSLPCHLLAPLSGPRLWETPEIAAKAAYTFAISFGSASFAFVCALFVPLSVVLTLALPPRPPPPCCWSLALFACCSSCRVLFPAGHSICQRDSAAWAGNKNQSSKSNNNNNNDSNISKCDNEQQQQQQQQS